MVEEKVGFVPRILVRGPLGTRDYGLLLTTSRAIFVLQSASKVGLGGALGGAIGGVIAAKLTTRRTIDPRNAEPELLARDAGSLSVWYAAISSVRIWKALSNTYHLRVDYATPAGMRAKIKGSLDPPPTKVAQNKMRGVGRDETARDYARQVRDAFRRAVPSSVRVRVGRSR